MRVGLPYDLLRFSPSFVDLEVCSCDHDDNMSFTVQLHRETNFSIFLTLSHCCLLTCLCSVSLIRSHWDTSATRYQSSAVHLHAYPLCFLTYCCLVMNWSFVSGMVVSRKRSQLGLTATTVSPMETLCPCCICISVHHETNPVLPLQCF